MATRERRLERGTVSAEAAVVIPVLVLFTVGLVWLVSLGVAHVRVVDAARETARAVARGESVGTATRLGRRVAPAGSALRVSTGRDLVVVRVSAPLRGPGGVFAALPRVHVTGRAVAAREPGS